MSVTEGRLLASWSPSVSIRAANEDADDDSRFTLPDAIGDVLDDNDHTGQVLTPPSTFVRQRVLCTPP